jgi:intracellular septation protein A
VILAEVSPRVAARRTVTSIVTKAVPGLILGAAVPAVCFIVGRRMWGLMGAICLALAWNGSCQAARWLRGRPLSGLLLIGLIGLIVRGSVAVALHSAQMFFIAPAVVTGICGLLFVGSGLMGRPLITPVVAELVPDSVLDVSDPQVARLMQRISVFYGAEQVVVAFVSVVMVLNLPTTTYLALHTVVSPLVLAAAVSGAGVLMREDLRGVIGRCQPAGQY